jgi:hypothetical protein
MNLVEAISKMVEIRRRELGLSRLASLKYLENG